MNAPQRVARLDDPELGSWTMQRREDEGWYVTERGLEPGSGWKLLREWPLGVIRAQTRDELVEALVERCEATGEIPREVAIRLAEEVALGLLDS